VFADCVELSDGSKCLVQYSVLCVCDISLAINPLCVCVCVYLLVGQLCVLIKLFNFHIMSMSDFNLLYRNIYIYCICSLDKCYCDVFCTIIIIIIIIIIRALLRDLLLYAHETSQQQQRLNG
jgi:hypothetical protein